MHEDIPPPRELANPEPPPLTFYGYLIRHAASKRAFFFDGSDTYIGTEGDAVAGKFRIVRIGAASAVVEDLGRKVTLMLPLPD